ncbi:MAG: hypothetical protein E6J15_03695 [Chloroflexi bacterium]|nr:MAG: hypothetical protein E6J15_03695 [Chloroflexota bacterium]
MSVLTAARWLAVLAATATAVMGAAAILSQAGSGAQPWDPELSDNFVFMKAIPFLLALGVTLGLVRHRAARRSERRASDGAIRRFSPGTVAWHWIITIGFLLALPTGVWQYLGGILDVSAPVPLYLFYRVHYMGAGVILLALASFVTYWWLNGERSLLVPRGQWRRHLAGLAHELPRRLGAPLAKRLGIDLTQTPPETGKFTFYEKVVEFPWWSVAIGLITVTGLVKAMRYAYPVPGPVLYWASTLHVAAMVLLVLKVLDHLRYTLERWPLVTAMVSTWLGEGYVRLRHPAWYRTIEGPAMRPGPRAGGAGATERAPAALSLGRDQ